MFLVFITCLVFSFYLFCYFIICNVIRIDKCLIGGKNSFGILTKQQQQQYEWFFSLFLYYYLICREEIIVIMVMKELIVNKSYAKMISHFPETKNSSVWFIRFHYYYYRDCDERKRYNFQCLTRPSLLTDFNNNFCPSIARTINKNNRVN